MTHHDDEVHQCDLHCGRPAPHTWICWDCHAQLVTALDAFTPDDLHHLQQVARREATPATRPTAHTTHQKGPAVPLHLGALTAHHAIESRFDGTLDGLPHDPDAAHHYHRYTSTLRYARELIDGDAPEFNDEQWDYVRSLPPMQSRTLVPWLLEHCGIRVSADLIKRWKERGRITPAIEEPGKHPYYRAVDVVRIKMGLA